MRQGIAGKLLRAVAGSRGSIICPLAPGWQRERELIAQARRKTQLLLTDPAALQLLACARAARSLPGEFAEAGVFKGGSAFLICEEKGDRPFHLFDVFAALQEGTQNSGEDVRAHFGSIYGTEGEVRALLAAYTDVHVHAGVFPATTLGLEPLRFSFVHLDLDLTQGTREALDFFHPRMIPGGILVMDDYCERYVKRCVDDWFAGRNDTFIELPWSQAMVIRRG